MLLYILLRIPVHAIHCRAFRASTIPSVPPSRQRKMAWEDMLHDHYPRSLQPPRVRQKVHDLKDYVHQGDKGLPPSFGKNKEHLQGVLGTGDSSARGECSTKIGSSDLCGSVPRVSFGICMPQKAAPIKLNPSLLLQNRKKTKEREQAKSSSQNIRLQPRLILLKNFLKHNDQVHDLKDYVHQGVKGLPPSFGKNKEHLQRVLGTGDSLERGECSTKIGSLDLCGSVPRVSFDICMPQKAAPIKLNPSLLLQSRGKRKERELAESSNQNIRLQPGLILLKNFLMHNDQVEIIRQCQILGAGSGGFYQPGYQGGAKLSLQMMCLGKNWDPQTRLYEDIRRVDGAKAPQIPVHFKKLVEEAIQTSHALIQQHTGSSHPVRAELPNLSPDLCVVNFYSRNGKLGLHQDKDESRESLDQGLPVVSFSLGDAADFLYGDSRDVTKAKSVTLENGDVLIFGGQSRHIFHGVRCIHPGTAPKRLLEETGLGPRRLNLTFRQF